MNVKFKRLNKPRIINYNKLNGIQIPARTKENSGATGLFVDNLVRVVAGSSTHETSGVDLVQFGIEVKSQDISTSSNWTIGTMTFEDIINTEYVNSSIYTKLQALLLVRYHNDLRVIVDSTLHYLDNDEVQTLIEAGYETARKEAIALNMHFHQSQAQRLFVFGDQKIEFTGSQQFKGTPGYCFEYNNTGTSFKFRISNREMKKITSIAAAVNNTNFQFE